MKKLMGFVLLLGLHAFALGSPIPTFELLWTGKALPFYGESGNEQQHRILEVMRNAHMAERMAAVSQGFRLRKNIEVGFESCGNQNAFFSPQREAIVICSEFLELIAQEFKSDHQRFSQFDKQQLSAWYMGVIWGVYFHEFAHALIHINRIPITGREEDVADQFSIWYAINYVPLLKQPVITPVAWFWGAMAKRKSLESMSGDALKNTLANEHSLDAQRIYNVACWALGANEEMGGRTAQFVGLPESRAVRENTPPLTPRCGVTSLSTSSLEENNACVNKDSEKNGSQ